MVLDLAEQVAPGWQPERRDVVGELQPLDPEVAGRTGRRRAVPGPSACRGSRPSARPACTLSLSRITSGSQTDVNAGSVSLGLSILTIEPKYGQSVGLICRDSLPAYL